MEKFFVLSGALINAGDYLITERTKQLLQEVYPGAELILFNRKKPFSKEDIELANSCEAIVYAGGPCVRKNLYPETVPLVPELDMLETKIVSVGLGWSGIYDKQREISKCRLSPETRKLFMRMSKDLPAISCRDYLTCNVLINNGIENALMTGCPAWYNLSYVHKERNIEFRKLSSIKKICISDPGNLATYSNQCVYICRYVKNAFPNAEIKFLFHKGFVRANEYINERMIRRAQELKIKLENMGIACEDISHGHDKMRLYDDCDLHIGYRVHAHIYNLSRGGISILIEEDARGAGVNDALNLRHIRAYSGKVKIPGRNKEIRTSCNLNVVDEISNWLERGFQTGFIDYKMAYDLIKEYYKKMIKHIETFV